MASMNTEGHSPAAGAEYVRKDVFDARMDRMDMLMEKTLTEIKADNEKLRSEVKAAVDGLRSEVNTAIGELRSEMRENDAQIRAEIKVLDSRIDGLNMRIDGVNMRVDTLQTTVYWGFTLMGLILAFAVLVPSLLDFFKGFRKPSLSAEDVERMISAALKREAAQ